MNPSTARIDPPPRTEAGRWPSGDSPHGRALWLVGTLLIMLLAYVVSYGVLRATGYLTRGENMDYSVTMSTPDAVYADGEIMSMRSWSDLGKAESPKPLSRALLRLYSPLIELEVRARWHCGWLPTR